MADDKLIKCLALIDAGQTTGGLVTPLDSNHEDPEKRNTRVWPKTSLNFQIAKDQLYMVHPAFLAADKKAGEDKTRRQSIFKPVFLEADKGPLKREDKKQ